MPEQLISASGTQYGLIIDDQGRAKVDIGTSVTITGLSIATGSQSYIFGLSGADWYGVAVDDQGRLISTSEAGSNVWVQNFGELGSNVTQGTSPWIITGSININSPQTIGSYSIQTITGTVDTGLYAGSNIFNRVAGSIVDWPGSLAITNFNALGSNVVVTNHPTYFPGSVNIVNFTEVGSLGVQTITGSVAITNSLNVSTGSQVYVIDTIPTNTDRNNPYFSFSYISSGTSTGINTGSRIGSVVQFIGAGSYVQVYSYSSNNLVNIGSWS